MFARAHRLLLGSRKCQLHQLESLKDSRCFSKTNNQSPEKRKRKRRGGRHFAKKQLIAKQAKHKNDSKLSEKVASRTTLGSKWGRRNQTNVPPVMLTQTFSPFTFVARTALDDPNDARSLFQDYENLPRLYKSHQFHYMPPKRLEFNYPKHNKPEVAFLGRSNSGKSSLCNALMHQNLCKTSKTPGRTQLPYYYGLFPDPIRNAKNNDNALSQESAIGYLVDLPGYGFGNAPLEVVDDWQTKTQEWLVDRRDACVLRRLFLLLDSRRDGGLSELDEAVVNWAEEAEIPFSLVLTKADRVGTPRILKHVNDLCMRYSSQHALVEDGTYQSPVVHVTSSKLKQGINDVLISIEAEFLGMEDEIYE